MGVYVQKGSPYYWVYLEQPGQRGTRESTMIPVAAGSRKIEKRNRQLVDDIYAARMGELARDRLLASHGTMSATPFTAPAPVPPPLQEDGWCYIYFVQRGHSVKIGKTTNLHKRLEAIRTASNEPVTLLASTVGHSSLERAIHQRFKALNESGEWFKVSDEMRAFIDAVNRGVNPVALLFEKAS